MIPPIGAEVKPLGLGLGHPGPRKIASMSPGRRVMSSRVVMIAVGFKFSGMVRQCWAASMTVANSIRRCVGIIF
jgi:hypothetical protein